MADVSVATDAAAAAAAVAVVTTSTATETSQMGLGPAMQAISPGFMSPVGSLLLIGLPATYA
jgi:hypothetical protein